MSQVTWRVIRRPVLVFCLIAFLIAVPVFALSGGGAPAAAQFPLLLVGSYAPAIAAVLVSRLTGEGPDLRRRIGRWRVRWHWYFLAVLTPGLTWLIAAVVITILGRPIRVSASSALLLPMIAITNFGEEIGWRGFVLPRLMVRRSPRLGCCGGRIGA